MDRRQSRDQECKLAQLLDCTETITSVASDTPAEIRGRRPSRGRRAYSTGEERPGLEHAALVHTQCCDRCEHGQADDPPISHSRAVDPSTAVLDFESPSGRT